MGSTMFGKKKQSEVKRTTKKKSPSSKSATKNSGPSTTSSAQKTAPEFLYISNEAHYDQVIERIKTVKKTLWSGTTST